MPHVIYVTPVGTLCSCGWFYCKLEPTESLRNGEYHANKTDGILVDVIDTWPLAG
jgi:hypothetical protein